MSQGVVSWEQYKGVINPIPFVVLEMLREWGGGDALLPLGLLKQRGWESVAAGDHIFSLKGNPPEEWSQVKPAERKDRWECWRVLEYTAPYCLILVPQCCNSSFNVVTFSSIFSSSSNSLFPLFKVVLAWYLSLTNENFFFNISDSLLVTDL